MRPRALTVRLVVPAALVVLVATLAALQYRWLGQVSEADRDRMQASLEQRARELADDFDRELLRVYLAFQTNRNLLSGRGPSDFASRYDAWRDSAKYPDFVRTFYLVDSGEGTESLRQYRPATRTFETVPWPDALGAVRSHLLHDAAPLEVAGDRGSPDRVVVTLRDPLVPGVPALVIPMPAFQPPGGSAGQRSKEALHATPAHVPIEFVIAELNRQYLRDSLFPALAARYFPEHDADAYRFAVVDPADRDHPIYTRGVPAGVTLDAAHGDAVVPLFSLRFDLASQVVALRALTWTEDKRQGGPPETGSARASGRQTSASMSIYVESRGSGGDLASAVGRLAGAADALRAASGTPAGAWQLVLQHPAGSLDAAVAQARRKNLWLSFGILAVLATGVGLIVVNAQRSQRLAAQQMDFVATVSHELRTPLTVIRSAAQNLSAGVVHDAAQARQYGDLIETEGRRLTGMVEQVLEYAGVSGNRRLPMAQPVDAGALVRDEAEACLPLCSPAGIELAVDVGPDLPLVVADADAIRRAIHNLVANAVKYGADGRWIGLRAEHARVRGRDDVQIAVSDRGRGIDAEELPHLFEPFYRGRYAVDRQIHGNGLGLSLVKRIAEAHGGRVTVKSAPGEGATFTLHLPAASADEAVEPMPAAAPDAGGPAA
jgi:signal transduction histidine kinase